MTTTDNEALELAVSRLMLGVSGIIKKYHNPAIHPKAMNDELDEKYHEAIAAIQQLITTERAEAERLGRIDELKHCYVDQGEIFVRFKGGFAEQYHRLAELTQEEKA